MTTETSSIDDLLAASVAPSMPDVVIEDDSAQDGEESHDVGTSDALAVVEEEIPEAQESETQTEARDDYGNEREKPRVYTEDEVNERINKAVRDRLARVKSPDAPLPHTQTQTSATPDGFNYNPNEEGNWEQQLEAFVEQTFNKINQRQLTRQQEMQEQNARAEFEDKFINGMERFNDFREVVRPDAMTDAMTLALRGIKDPAAFVYAASKRQPEELSRIKQIQDPYAQMVEIGRLEERMRKAANGTSAPRPVSRTTGDAHMPESKKAKEDTIEDLIARSDAKRRAQLTAKRGRG